MAVNKNFVVKNGIEVNDNLIIGISTNKTVGIGSTQPEYNLDVRGGIGVTDLIVSGGSTTKNLAVSAAATTKDLLVTGVSTFTGIGTFGSDVYVDGNLTVVGDISYDEIDGRNLNITGIATIAKLGVSIATTTKDLLVTGVSTLTGNVDFGGSVNQLNVSGVSSHVGFATFSDNVYITGYSTVTQDLTVLGDLNVTGDLSYDEVTGRNIKITGLSTFEGLGYFGSNVGIGTTNPTAGADSNNTTILSAGIVTANYFYGDISNATGIATGLSAAIGVSSEGTFVGSGATIINFASSTAGAWDVQSSGGIATATVTPGASLGMVIALGS